MSLTLCGISLYFGIVRWRLPASNRSQSSLRGSPWLTFIYKKPL